MLSAYGGEWGIRSQIFLLKQKFSDPASLPCFAWVPLRLSNPHTRAPGTCSLSSSSFHSSAESGGFDSYRIGSGCMKIFSLAQNFRQPFRIPTESAPHFLHSPSLTTFVAESGGFEPPRAFTPCLVSSEVLSTTQPTLHHFGRRAGFGSNTFVRLKPTLLLYVYTA